NLYPRSGIIGEDGAIMRGPSQWARGEQSLPVLLGVVVAVPAITLVVLGLRLFQQEQDLARTRRLEQLESAADRAVRVVDQNLRELTRRLSSPISRPDPPGAGSIDVTIDDTDVHIEPAYAVAWYPRGQSVEEPVPQVFAQLDADEFR